jgi:hypothetical protein
MWKQTIKPWWSWKVVNKYLIPTDFSNVWLCYVDFTVYGVCHSLLLLWATVEYYGSLIQQQRERLVQYVGSAGRLVEYTCSTALLSRQTIRPINQVVWQLSNSRSPMGRTGRSRVDERVSLWEKGRVQRVGGHLHANWRALYSELIIPVQRELVGCWDGNWDEV